MRRRERGFTLIEILVVIAIIATLVAAVSVTIPLVQDRNNRLACAKNLKEVGTLFINYQQEHQGRPKYDGVAMFLYFRVTSNDIRKNEESVLICPGDQQVINPNTPELQAKYDDEVDLTNPPDDMCSYAVRDFTTYPLSVEAKEAQIVACDRNGNNGRTLHHRDGLNILYDNGASKFMSREDLGISGDADIVVGPASEHELLKQVVYIPNKKE
jgi:prepilin-type N-terminal cleavage/methylation domain-containing protein